MKILLLHPFDKCYYFFFAYFYTTEMFQKQFGVIGARVTLPVFRDHYWPDFSTDGQYVISASPLDTSRQAAIPPDQQLGWPGLGPAIDEVG